MDGYLPTCRVSPQLERGILGLASFARPTCLGAGHRRWCRGRRRRLGGLEIDHGVHRVGDGGVRLGHRGGVRHEERSREAGFRE